MNSILVSGVLFGLTALSVKTLVGHFSGSQIVFFRFFLGGLCIAPPLAARRDWWPIKSFKLWALRGLLGGFAVLCWFDAISRIPVAMAALLNYTSPVYATVLGAWFLREYPSRAQLFFGALAFSGSMLVALAGGFAAMGAPGAHGVAWGYFLATVSAIFSGASIVAMRALGQTDHPLMTFLALCLGGSACALFGAAGWRWPTAYEWLLVAVMVLVSLAAQILFTSALRKVPAAVGAMTMQLSVVVTWLGAWLMFNERPTVTQEIGALIILIGVIGIAYHRRAEVRA